jgi:hypothetical protein
VRCKIDENLPIEAADLLRTSGHECHTVFDIRTYPPSESPGIVVLRPSAPDRDRILRLVRQVLVAFDRDAVAQAQIRIRRSGEAAV